MARRCGQCGGQGRVLGHLNPNATNYGNTTFVRCPSCGGRGETGWRDDEDPREDAGASGRGAHPVVWLFGSIGALFFGVLKPLAFADWFFNAFAGFVSIGMAAGFLRERRWGRVVLSVVGIAFIALVAATIYMAEAE